jgi:hypothetical protein
MDLFLTTGPLTGEAAKRKTLAWPTRPSIALGAARGKLYWGIQLFLLNYLLTYHTESRSYVEKLLTYCISYWQKVAKIYSHICLGLHYT